MGEEVVLVKCDYGGDDYCTEEKDGASEGVDRDREEAGGTFEPVNSLINQSIKT